MKKVLRKKLTGVAVPLLLCIICFVLTAGGCGVRQAETAAADLSAGAEAQFAISEGIQVAAEEPVLLEKQDDGGRVLYADLTHDGKDEKIVLNVKTGEADFTEAEVTVLADDGNGVFSPVYEKHIDSSHTGWGWLYLYEENGLAYLVDYDPVLYEGTSRYSCTVFSLTETGGEDILYHDTLSFEWTGEDDPQLKEQIAEFNRKAFIYMNQAQVLAAIGEEYFSSIYACDFIGQ